MRARLAARRLASLGALVLLGGCASLLAPRARLVPPTAERDARLPQLALRVAGRTRAVHLRVVGDSGRPVLLVLHGSLSDHRSLLPLAALADRYRVVLWDQRGNGLSERVTPAEYTLDAIVEEIDAIADRFSPGRPVTLVGHSFGAMYAALYMSRRPARVREAALLEPGGLTGRVMTATFRQIINVRLLEPNVTRAYWQNTVLTATDHDAIDQKALLVLANGRQTNYFCDPARPTPISVWRPGAHVEYLRGALMGAGFGRFRYDFAVGLDTLPRRVLLVGGSCSALGGAFQRRWHQPLFRDARVVELPGVGHRLVSEAPEAVLATLREFLAEYRR
ncbi:MAG TPA: alpha/beta hydrolase [Gemmatimonadaceae bacterium]|nr:alpha/beta hydrolase [Gemmatimonadaceae bacterium]